MGALERTVINCGNPKCTKQEVILSPGHRCVWYCSRDCYSQGEKPRIAFIQGRWTVHSRGEHRNILGAFLPWERGDSDIQLLDWHAKAQVFCHRRNHGEEVQVFLLEH